MALFNEEFREMIKDFFSVADSHMLNKLKRGIVVDENDCTSQFTSAVREQFPNHFPITIKAYSQKLPATIEQEWGVDGVILLVDHELNQGKICLFEAKIDRRNWDYIQKKLLATCFSFFNATEKTKSTTRPGLYCLGAVLYHFTSQLFMFYA